MTGARRIIIDGYNVIRTNPSGSRIEQDKGGTAARQWLVDLCCSAMTSGERWQIIFDGDGSGEACDSSGAQLSVRFAAPRTADELIRDLAADAVATGSQCLIVSSDREVRLESCAFQDSAAFYDWLLRHAGQHNPEASDTAPEMIDKLLAYLAECGHIDKGAFISEALRDALNEMVRYFAAEKIKPQKIARGAEKLLREAVRLSPDPDPEKAVFRNIKHFFEKVAG